MPAPKINRVYKVTSVNIYRNHSSFYLIFDLASNLRLRDIALKAAIDAQKAILMANARFHHLEPFLPIWWIAYDLFFFLIHNVQDFVFNFNHQDV